jgi:hypothetical protein
LLDNEGYVAEGSGENFFLVKDDGILYTPELTSCLEGITRDTIIQFARELGLEVREKRITRDEVYVCNGRSPWPYTWKYSHGVECMRRYGFLFLFPWPPVTYKMAIPRRQ